MGFEEILGQEKGGLVLLHPTSLPDPEGRSLGVGELGSEAFRFVDFLADSKTLAWQVLPLGHTGFKDSPYQTFSRFAGSPLMISVEKLFEARDIPLDAYNAYQERVRRAGISPRETDYGWLFSNKIGGGWNYPDAILRQAFLRFSQRDGGDPRRVAFRKFVERHAKGNRGWLRDYADFMALKETHLHHSWTQWPEEYREAAIFRERRDDLLKELPELARSVAYFEYLQFVFFEQWEAVRRHAQDKGILLIGDLPWYVGYDSSDVWARREVFDLDPQGNPRRVAGVPPDAFSDTGQLWGNPLYDWRGEAAIPWWVESMEFILDIVDIVRLDHVRAADTYWVVPIERAESEGTAINGYWEKGPGAPLIEALVGRLTEKGRIQPGGPPPIIAEDLGCFDPLYPTVEDYPEDFLRKNCYPLSPDFSKMLKEKDPEVAGGLVLETGEFSTRKGVNTLLDQFDLPGMVVLQFCFDDPKPFRPDEQLLRAVAYTGTHDNDTALGWLREKTATEKKNNREWYGDNNDAQTLSTRIRIALSHCAAEQKENPSESQPEAKEGSELETTREMIRLAWGSECRLAGVPLQDLLAQGSEGRMNMPGDSEGQWWSWRAAREDLDYDTLAKNLRAWNEKYDRVDS